MCSPKLKSVLGKLSYSDLNLILDKKKPGGLVDYVSFIEDVCVFSN